MGIAEYYGLILFAGSAFSFSIIIALFIVLKLSTTKFPIITRFKDEKYFKNPKTGEKFEFPSINDEPSLELSVVVPAFDEEQRLSPMLDECLEYLERRVKENKDFSYEILIVSDGSRDKTVDVALKYVEIYGTEKIRVLALVKNRGKGGAVRLGMQSSRGKYLLFADADGATKFEDYQKIETSMKVLAKSWKDEVIVIGSRAHLEEEATATRSLFRTILMHGFHLLVWIFAVKNIRDTQCGFKLLTRSAAITCFSIMHVERWAFDVELLFIAQSLKMPIDEIAVRWTEIDGSKVTPFWSWIQMGRDLILIWLRYAIGAWKLQSPEHQN